MRKATKYHKKASCLVVNFFASVLFIFKDDRGKYGCPEKMPLGTFRETSPAAKSEEKGMFCQARKRIANILKVKYKIYEERDFRFFNSLLMRGTNFFRLVCLTCSSHFRKSIFVQKKYFCFGVF